MTKVFRFTDGSTANSYSGAPAFPVGTPFNTGTARPRPATRQAIFDEIDLALQATGMTRYVKTAGVRHVFESDGESGDENFAIELNYLSSTRYLHVNIAPKLDASNELEGGIGNNISSGGGADIYGRMDFGVSDFTSDFMILADKDGMTFVIEEVAHSGAVTWMSAGLLKRGNILNPNFYTLAADALAGDNVILDVTGSGSPLGEGYRPGQIVMIVETAKAETAKAHKLLVTDVGASSITVASLPFDYHIGAKVGANPCPLVRTTTVNRFPDDPIIWSSPFSVQTAPPGPDYAGSGTANDGDILAGGNGYVLNRIFYSVGPTFASSGEYGSGSTPNNRTQRFTCRNISLGGVGGSVLGCHRQMVAYPGVPGLFPSDWYHADRLSPAQYYAAFRPHNNNAQYWGLGPTI